MWLFRPYRDLELACGVMRERVALLTRERDAAREQADYWRSKAELLLDQTLFRRGEVTTQIFSAAPKPQTEQTFASIFSPLAVTEIESGKRRSAVTPNAPIR